MSDRTPQYWVGHTPEQVKALQDKCERYERALKWYASQEGANGEAFYICHSDGSKIVPIVEIGERAREALNHKEGE